MVESEDGLGEFPGGLHRGVVAEAEVRDQLVQVLGRVLAVVVAWRGVRVAEAAQVHGEDPVAGGEQGMTLPNARQVSGNPWTSGERPD